MVSFIEKVFCFHGEETPLNTHLGLLICILPSVHWESQLHWTHRLRDQDSLGLTLRKCISAPTQGLSRDRLKIRCVSWKTPSSIQQAFPECLIHTESQSTSLQRKRRIEREEVQYLAKCTGLGPRQTSVCVWLCSEFLSGFESSQCLSFYFCTMGTVRTSSHCIK